MKKTDKIIYIILICLMILPILIPRIIIEYNLRLYSSIKIGTKIEDSVNKIKEINNNNRYLLNFFIDRNTNEENFSHLESDRIFLDNQKEKIILSSGLLNNDYLKNSYYVNRFFNNCHILIEFNDKEVIENKSSCEDLF